MGFRDWPYWIKGGIITGLAYTLFTLLGLLIRNTELYNNSSLVEKVINFPHMGGIIILLLSGNLPFTEEANFLVYISNSPIYLILGAIIGWIYGKIKNRA